MQVVMKARIRAELRKSGPGATLNLIHQNRLRFEIYFLSLKNKFKSLSSLIFFSSQVLEKKIQLVNLRRIKIDNKIL